ncbi:uncharacterized protein SPSK_04531 [Sporothrix schenckii 1099-18]|uniref:Carboxymuconolactone decarboxylase-like domain-containing protein n=2 Tax=Sporothrix schenckii TaxID=29908 RepID=U7PLH9_SPOS1|nr:uncharacterized protein SPSK_04531 [Sporothrix schenckii 1099-18]ERS95801.1 hypothetical protein HMPREF1624_07877 [Sporothrix schenckii ATCC 58251]KJR83823.1 hypothetical protein SPSK_04531 [Sporothrix schenckii 1099-18]
MQHATDADMAARARAFVQQQADEAASKGTTETWYCITACAFAACNQGGFVGDVYKAAIASSDPDDIAHQQLVLRRIKEALLKTSVIFGIPRTINAFRALVRALPSPAANEVASVRSHIARPADTDARGLAYMRNIFRADLDPFLDTMDQYWPDLRTLVVTTIYGYYQSDTTVLGAVATSQLNIATLVPMDVTAEVAWHMRGVIRNGGTRDDLDYAFATAMAACEICDVRLKNTMPRPEDVVNEERLF